MHMANFMTAVSFAIRKMFVPVASDHRQPGDGVARAAERLRKKQAANRKIPSNEDWTRQRSRRAAILQRKRSRKSELKAKFDKARGRLVSKK